MRNFELLKSKLYSGTAATMLGVLGCMGAGSVSAQDNAAADDEEELFVEEVVVTGSRLRKSVQTSSVPIFVIDSEEFENRGFINVGEAIANNPFFVNSTSNQGGQVQNGDSFTFPNSLGLGTQRTLTLFNGRRFVATNQNTVFVPGNATGAQVDLSIINPALLERTETVVATGGAVYGADAVGGVVNLIAKEDFEGVNVTTQFGITDRGDGETYRVNAAYGQNFDNDRGNFALSFEYSNQDQITQDRRTFFNNGRATITNPLNGNFRNPDPFSASNAAAILAGGGSLPAAFLPAGADGIASTVSLLNAVNPTVTLGGALAGGQGAFSGIQQVISNGLVPGGLAGAAADPAGFAFFAPSSLPAGVDPNAVIASLAPGTSTTGLTGGQLNSLALGLLQRNRPTPAEFFAANPGINPNLFAGTFGDPDAFPTILNTDPATSALFPRIAVPLQFDTNGNLVPLVVGQRNPAITDIDTVIGGDGLPNTFFAENAQLISSSERISAFGRAHYDLTDNLTVFGDFIYSNTRFETVTAPDTNSGFNGTSGTGSLRIFIDENPFVTDQALTTLNDLAAQGLNIATQDGSRFINVNRNLADLLGGTEDQVTETDTFYGTLGLRGDFEALNRNFYWETAFVYGRSETTNTSDQIFDIEFFLALDVVEDANGNPVCRQQTLSAPESIAVRNPGLAGLANNFGLVPTQAQIDACQPLNLLGEGNISQAAIDNIVFDGVTRNTTELYYASGQFGGDIIDLPAGALIFNTQLEYRRESNSLTPSFEIENGLSRNANTPPADGVTEFVEWGVEAQLPVFDGDFTFPGLKFLEFSGAYRIVNRTQDTNTELFADILDDISGVTDSVWQVKGEYRPIDDLLVRANYSTSVRSPSQTELFGSLQFAFANANGAFPCTSTTVNQGPNPSVRAQNCATLFGNLGIANPESFAATFQNINVGETAGVVGNPFLSNEQADSFSVGFIYTPSWLEGFFIGADYIEVDIENQIGLNGPAVTLPACFDSPDFPNVDLNGTNPCDQFIFGAQGANGVFTVPADGISQITGNPVLVGPSAGLPINGQGPGQVAFSFFSNLNLATTELRYYTFSGGYNFRLEDVFGARAENWGRIRLNATLNFTERFDIFSTGEPSSLNPQAGDAIPRWQGRFDLDYAVGDFGALVQLFHTSGTSGNVQTDPANFPEQANTFFVPAFNRFNLNLRYRINDQFTVRGIVNNVFDNNGAFGEVDEDPFFITFDPVGRQYFLTLSASF